MTNHLRIDQIDDAAASIISDNPTFDRTTSPVVLHAAVLNAYPDQLPMTRLRIRTRMLDALRDRP